MDNPKVAVRRTRKMGRAVFALKRVRKGEEIAAFDGAKYDGDYEPWTEDLLNHAIQIGPDLWQDSRGLARWINHSCDPNCGIKRRTHIVAMRDIEPGEQITWDYEMTEKSTWWRMKCRCGSPRCRKMIGSYANMPRSVRARYRGFISSWLRPRRRRSR